MKTERANSEKDDDISFIHDLNDDYDFIISASIRFDFFLFGKLFKYFSNYDRYKCVERQVCL